MLSNLNRALYRLRESFSLRDFSIGKEARIDSVEKLSVFINIVVAVHDPHAGWDGRVYKALVLEVNEKQDTAKVLLSDFYGSIHEVTLRTEHFNRGIYCVPLKGSTHGRCRSRERR